MRWCYERPGPGAAHTSGGVQRQRGGFGPEHFIRRTGHVIRFANPLIDSRKGITKTSLQDGCNPREHILLIWYIPCDTPYSAEDVNALTSVHPLYSYACFPSNNCKNSNVLHLRMNAKQVVEQKANSIGRSFSCMAQRVVFCQVQTHFKS